MENIGENIRSVRRSFGETQEELGKAVFLGGSTIAMYERGDRQPGVDILEKIAAHYNLPVDLLMKSDLSDEENRTFPVTPEKMLDFLEVLVPLYHSEEAMGKDPLFAKGMDLCSRFWAQARQNGIIMDSMLTEALLTFSQSLKEQKSGASAANMLWILYMRFLLLPSEGYELSGQQVLEGRGEEKDFFKTCLLPNWNREDAHYERLRKEYIETHHQRIIGLIRALKKTTTYSDLADYYLGLMYFVNMVDQGYSPELTKNTGLQMMLSFMELDNPYADALLTAVAEM